MSLLKLQNDIHKQNLNKGWWDNFRSFSTLTNLNISEVSEAVEADRKQANDDKLKQYLGVPVECADGAIRCFDVLSSFGNSHFDPSKHVIDIINAKGKSIDFLMALATLYFSKAWEYEELNDDRASAMQCLRDAAYVLFEIMFLFGHIPTQLMLEKMEYNKTRADHMKENREKEGGKKY